MAFLVGLLVNTILISIPIGGTLGVLFGIHPFEGERRPLYEGAGLVTKTLCDDFHTFIQNNKGQSYTLNSNEIRAERNSTLCTTITAFENATYPINTTIPEFSFTWNYPFRIANESAPANESTPAIHAFPQARIADGSVLPIRLEDLGVLNLDFAWTMGVGKERAYTTSTRKLGAHEVNSTVALDMYMDQDEGKAGDAMNAAFEMLVFFAWFGDADPVGFGNGTVVRTETLNGTDFHLFIGKNAKGQTVFSWVSSRPMYEFHSDIAPLFDSIITLRGNERVEVDVLTFAEFLGYVGFGTQVFNADDYVTFYAPRLSIDVRKF